MTTSVAHHPRSTWPANSCWHRFLPPRHGTGWCPPPTTYPEGGLIQAVVESALAGETGCRLLLPEGADPFVALFSESAGRVLVAVPRTEESRFMSMCEARQLPAVRIGVVDQGSDSVEVQGQFSVTLAELREIHEGVLPGLFG